MSNLSKMSGTPWHTEILHCTDNDKKRHCSRCIYFNPDNKFCTKRFLKCVGSAHCEIYKEMSTEKINIPNIPIWQNAILNKLQPWEVKLNARKYKYTAYSDTALKRKKFSEKIGGITYNLNKAFFSSVILFNKYTTYLCEIEDKIIEKRILTSEKADDNMIVTEGINCIQETYNLICLPNPPKSIIAEKIDFQFINNFYYPMQSFESIKIAFEKCLWIRLHNQSPNFK